MRWPMANPVASSAELLILEPVANAPWRWLTHLRFLVTLAAQLLKRCLYLMTNDITGYLSTLINLFVLNGFVIIRPEVRGECHPPGILKIVGLRHSVWTHDQTAPVRSSSHRIAVL